MHRTLDKILQNLAANATDLKHATSLKDAAASAHHTARRIEAGAPVGDATVAAVAARERRPAPVDADGYKLFDKKVNNFDTFSPEVKGIYARRDKVTTKQQFEQDIAHRPCRNCPPDAWNMPHREGVCTVTWGSSTEAASKMPPSAHERRKQRVRDNIDKLENGEPATTYMLDEDDIFFDNSQEEH